MRMTRNISYGRASIPLNDRILRNNSPDGMKHSAIQKPRRKRKKKTKNEFGGTIVALFAKEDALETIRAKWKTLLQN